MRFVLTAAFFGCLVLDATSRAALASAGADFPSGDADGKLIGLWLWLLPIAGALCGAAYMACVSQLHLDRTAGRKPESIVAPLPQGPATFG